MNETVITAFKLGIRGVSHPWPYVITFGHTDGDVMYSSGVPRCSGVGEYDAEKHLIAVIYKSRDQQRTLRVLNIRHPWEEEFPVGTKVQHQKHLWQGTVTDHYYQYGKAYVEVTLVGEVRPRGPRQMREDLAVLADYFADVWEKIDFTLDNRESGR